MGKYNKTLHWEEVSRDSLLWRDRSHDLTAREGCHIGQRLWNYLGWHRLAFPCKILPQGAMSRLIIDVNQEKRTLISPYPVVPSNLHTIPLLKIRVHWERAGERFWWWVYRFRATDRRRPSGVSVGMGDFQGMSTLMWIKSRNQVIPPPLVFHTLVIHW